MTSNRKTRNEKALILLSFCKPSLDACTGKEGLDLILYLSNQVIINLPVLRTVTIKGIVYRYCPDHWNDKN